MFTDAKNLANPTTIQVAYSVRNHVKNVKRTMSKTIFMPDATATAAPVPGPLLDTAIIAQVVSPSGTRRAVWRKTGEDRFVEVWESTHLVHQWLVTDVHGDVYADGEFLSNAQTLASDSGILTLLRVYQRI